jgi:hypothetical protein
MKAMPAAFRGSMERRQAGEEITARTGRLESGGTGHRRKIACGSVRGAN